MDAMRWFLVRLIAQRRSWFAALILAITWGLALALRIVRGDLEPLERLELYRDNVGPFLVSAVVLLIALLYATAAFAQEVEDRTIFLLFTRPYPRARLLLHKALAAWLVCASLGSLAVLVPALILLPLEMAEARSVALAYLVAALLASTAYAALFLRVGLAVWRPMVWAAGIALGWEGLVGTTPGNLQQLTVQHQAARFLARTVAPETWTLELPLRVPEGSELTPVFVLLGIAVWFVFSSWRRLRGYELR